MKPAARSVLLACLCTLALVLGATPAQAAPPTTTDLLERLRAESPDGPSWELDGPVLRGGLWSGASGRPVEVARAICERYAPLLDLSRDAVQRLGLQEVTETPGGTRVSLAPVHQGLVVINATVEVFVDAQGRVFRAQAQPVAAIQPVGGPQRTRQSVRSRLESATLAQVAADKGGRSVARGLGRMDVQSQQLALWATPQGVRLVHDAVVDAPDQGFRARHVIDDATGDVLSSRSLTVSFDGSGQVFDPNPINVAPWDGTLRHADAESKFTSRYVTRPLLGIAMENGLFVLAGPYARIVDTEAPTVAAPQESLLTGFVYPRGNPHFAAVTAYYALDTASRRIHDLGFSTLMSTPLRFDPHGLDGDDNAHYISGADGKGTVAFGDGGVPDAEDGDIVLHEMGHAIQDDQTKGRYLYGGEAGAMGEGFSDWWACVNTYHKSLASGYDPAYVAEWDATVYNPSSAPHLRVVNSLKAYPQDMQGKTHADGEIWSAALWAIYTGVPDAQKDDVIRVVLQSHYLVPNQPSFRDGALALLDANRALRSVGDYSSLIGGSMVSRGVLRHDAPGNLQAKSADGGVVLTWSDASDVESSYRVDRLGSGTIATLLPGTLTFTDLGVIPGDEETYTVTAVGATGTAAVQDPSSTVSIKVEVSTAVSSQPSSSGSSGGGSSSGGGGSAGGGGGGGGGCFIATAAYGSRMEAHVATLRAFRDRALLPLAPGRAFVRFYYRWSPPVADWIRPRPWARAATRVALAPVIFGVTHPMAMGLCLLLAALSIRARARRGGALRAARSLPS